MVSDLHVTETGGILVIDDDATVRAVSTRMLLRAGFHVDSAEDAESGWTALGSKSYQLLITDYDMPGMNGLELVKRVRAFGLTLPVILMSGQLPAKIPALSELIQPGAILSKPFSYEKLLATVAGECLPKHP